MISAVKPGVLVCDNHINKLVFFIEGKRQRHVSKMFEFHSSIISSIPEVDEDYYFVFDPVKAVGHDRSACLVAEKDENVRVLTDRLHRESFNSFQGTFLLGFHRGSPGIVFRTEEDVCSFFSQSPLISISKMRTGALPKLLMGGFYFLSVQSLISISWDVFPIEEVRFADISAYGVVEMKSNNSIVSNSRTTLQDNSFKNKKFLELANLGEKLHLIKGTDITRNENLNIFISARLNFIKHLRTHFRWEAEAIFWNLKVWWRCEIAYQHVDAPRKLSSLKYGVDYFFDIFHLMEVIIWNPEFASNKKAIPIEVLDRISLKYSHCNYSEAGNSMDLPSRIFQLASSLNIQVFDDSYFQEMLVDEGWLAFVLSDPRKPRKSSQSVYYIPPEHQRRLKITQENFLEFKAEKDYFTDRRAVIKYVLNNYGRKSKNIGRQQQVIEKNASEIVFSESKHVEVDVSESNFLRLDNSLVGATITSAATTSESNFVLPDGYYDELPWTEPAPQRSAPIDDVKKIEKPIYFSNNRSKEADAIFTSICIDKSPPLDSEDVRTACMLINKAKTSVSRSRPSNLGNDLKLGETSSKDAVILEDNPNEAEPNLDRNVIDLDDEESIETREKAIASKPVIYPAKVAAYAMIPGVNIVTKFQNDDPNLPIILYIVENSNEILTEMPIPVGCDPRCMKF
jgi:hypothetical protein